MESVHNKYTQRELRQVGTAQTKVASRMELPTAAKKVLSVTPTVLVTGVENKETEHVVTGKVLTRAVFVDEFDGYNSEEIAEDFTCTVPSERGVTDVVPNVSVMQSTFKETKNETENTGMISAEHVVNVGITGLNTAEVKYVSEATGEIESKTAEREICTFSGTITEKFEIGEVVTLDANAIGVLGVEVNASIRDIDCKDGKVTVKGVVCAGVTIVKNIDDGQTISNTFHEFDFSKSFKHNGDVVCGNVLLSNISMKVEHRENPELVLEIGALFTGFSVCHQTINIVEDAFSCTHDVDFDRINIVHTGTLPQVNQSFDIEGNVNLPSGSPFVNRAVWATAGSVGQINVKPYDDKVIVEGVLVVNIVYECEERQIYSYVAEVPFSVNVKMNGVTPEHNIGANITPMLCNVKARRGKELLIDARVCVSLFADLSNESEIVSNIIQGNEKQQSGSAISLIAVQPKETLWQVAKRVGMPMSEIIKQNPECENELQGGERITVYRQRKCAY